ncbi:hypothetical protein PF005_g4287 [Phytophthora fragariae]|uniref:Transmembrane protein n=2 Tax=Phytophthora fragariae TaxID=53985 RepID=A0A6A4EU35_9STRA|nr:hypothetical protein PF003_g32843 [Phytophthora fragariae]KAE9130760.1 hypothetical protein PF007_g4384 [Phytophthora fragariae]KAE9228493.1 hypothetical protein PF005_g4287 [Phytophthora fragariae]KAE9324374.1 hypothetical protein PF001_g3456 [Phytophthora fragariae]
MTMIRVFPFPRRHTTPDEKFMKSRRRSEIRDNASFLYKFEATRSLPVVDLRRTLSHWLLGPQLNLKFPRWMKRNFGLLHCGQMLGTLLTLVVIAAPRDVGQVLGPLSVAMSLMSIVSTIGTASTDVLRLLTRHYEFWFFSVANLVTWSLLAFFLADPLRILSLVPLWLILQLTVSMDANFRTFVVAVRSNILVLAVLIIIAALVFLMVIDVDSARLEWVIPIYSALDVTLPVIGLFENALATLIPFVMRVLFTKRKLFGARSAGSKLVRCQLYHAQLVLRPVRYSRTASLGVETNRRSYVLHKQLGITAPEMSITSGNDTARHHQQVTLVALRLSAIDTRNTLLLSWPVKTSGRLCIFKLFGIYATGSAGLALTVATLGLPPSGNQSPAQYAVPVVGFMLTMGFCTVFDCASQRDMLRALLFHNFGFLFSMTHCSVACLCVADMMSWDYRCWAVASAFVWFVWVQLLDVVTPLVRRQLVFSKVQVVPVLWLLWALMFVVAYASVFIPMERSGLRGRDLVRFHVGHNVTVLNTKSILLNRLFIMFFWMQRHAWNVFTGAFTRCWRLLRPPKPSEVPEEEANDPDEEELSTMRGSLEYFCPFDTFPGVKHKLSRLERAVTSARSIRRISLTGRHCVRRLSSAILLSGVVAPSAKQQQKPRRGAFGQRSGNSQSESDTHSNPKTGSWTNSVPGMVRDE